LNSSLFRAFEYPDAALWQHQQELFDAIAASEKLAPEDAHKLSVFLRDLTAQDAGRAVSLQRTV
jgi:nitrate reductase delta subunit